MPMPRVPVWGASDGALVAPPPARRSVLSSTPASAFLRRPVLPVPRPNLPAEKLSGAAAPPPPFATDLFADVGKAAADAAGGVHMHELDLSSRAQPPPPNATPSESCELQAAFRELSANEEWEIRVARPRRAAAAAKAAEFARADGVRKAAAARAAETAALASHGNANWRAVGQSAAVQTLHSLQVFATQEQCQLKGDADFLNSVQLAKMGASSPLLTRRRAAVDAFVKDWQIRRSSV